MWHKARANTIRPRSNHSLFFVVNIKLRPTAMNKSILSRLVSVNCILDVANTVMKSNPNIVPTKLPTPVRNMERCPLPCFERLYPSTTAGKLLASPAMPRYIAVILPKY